MTILFTTLTLLQQGRDLSAEESRALFDTIFDGNASESEIEALLLALRAKGESVSEIQGAVASMRGHMNAITAPDDAVDIVGTGGDGHGTLNVSTAAAIVVAGAGVPVAKHGNRAASSLSGSSDVLAALGVNLEPKWESLERAAHDVGLVFLFAPRHHPAMRFVAPVRKKLKVRTVFNLLGPLTNPAGVKRHLIGVFDPAWSQPMAQTLKALGSVSAWITHGADALDELSTTGENQAVILGPDGVILRHAILPEACGLPRAKLENLKGSDAAENARAIRDLLAGERTPYRDIVMLNAAAALMLCGKATDLQDGVRRAAKAIDSGAAAAKLDALVAVSKG